MSQHTWSTAAVQDGLDTMERLTRHTKFYSYLLAIPVKLIFLRAFYGEEGWSNLSHFWVGPTAWFLDSMYRSLVSMVASTGLRISIPVVDIGLTVIEPFLPDQCTSEFQRLHAHAWPCIREDMPQYVQRVGNQDGDWKQLFGPGWEHVLDYLILSTICTGLAVYHVLKRRSMRRRRRQYLDQGTIEKSIALEDGARTIIKKNTWDGEVADASMPTIKLA